MSRHWRSVLVTSFLICMLMTTAFAETAKVVGTIRNTDTYDPLAGYSVILKDVNTGSVMGPMLTGADGKYSFGFVQPSTYVLVVSKDGADVKTTEKFDVEVGATIPQNVELEIKAAVVAPPPPPPVDPCVANPTAPGCEAQAVNPCAVDANSDACKHAEFLRCQNNASDPKCHATYCVHNPDAAGCKVVARTPPPPAKPTWVRNDLNTSISSAVTRDQLQSLPLYNRNFLVLGLLTPNTHEVEAGSTLQGGSFSVAGVRAASNNFVMDGIDNVASSSGQAIPFQVNDSIREFRVTSSGASAEYGRNSGGVVDIVTQRASSKVHGAAYGYFGADALNMKAATSIYNGTTFDKAAQYAGSTSAVAAPLQTVPVPAPGSGAYSFYSPTSYNQYVATANALGYCTNPGQAFGSANCNPKFDPNALLSNVKNKAPFTSEQFGASIGGPVTPVKNLFLYGSYEGTRIDNPNPIFERVPTSYDRTAAGATSNYSIAQNIMNLYPAANVVGAPNALGFYKGFAPNHTNVDNLLLRTDWSWNSGSSKGFNRRNNLTARYAAQRLSQLHDDSLPEGGSYPGNGAVRDAVNQSVSLAVTSFISAHVSNDLRFGVNRFQIVETPQDSFNNFNPSTLGLGAGSMPTIFLAGLDNRYSGLTCLPGGACTTGTSPTQQGATASWQDSSILTSPATAKMLPTLDGQFPYARLGAPLTAPGHRRDTGGFVSNQMAYQIGHHSWKFGGEFRLYQNVYTSGGQTRGYINSANIGQFDAGTERCYIACGAGAGSALGFPSFDYRIQQPSDYRGLLKSFSASAFLQDTWQASDRLTFNYGIRYELFSVPSEQNNQIWNYDPVANGLVKPGVTTPVNQYGSACPVTGTVPNFMVPTQWTGQNLGWKCGASTQQKGLYQNDTKDFAPRFGFAYSLDKANRTVVRGSIGYFFDQQPVGNMEQMLLNRPNPYNLANPEALYGSYSNIINCTSVGHCGGIGNSTLAGGAAINSVFQSASVPGVLYAKDYNHSKTPYTRQVSGSVQHLVGQHLGFEIGYVGTSGYRLPVVVNTNFQNEWFCTNKGSALNPCDPFSFAPIFTQTNLGKSDYNSAMVRMHGSWKDFSINATYTYAYSNDNVVSSSYPTLPTTAMANVYGFQLLGTGQVNLLQAFGFRQGFSTLNGIPSPSPTVVPDFSVAALTTTGAGRILTTPYNISQNPMNWQKDDWGSSDFDSRHRIVVDYSYKFGKKDNPFLSDWQISSIFAAQAGQPYTVFSSMFGELTQRANNKFFQMSNDPNAWISTTSTLSSVLPSLSTACATAKIGTNLTQATGGYVLGSPFQGTAGSACTGNTARNSFTGPSYINNDLAVQKQIHFKGNEARYITLRSEFYNLFNRANYYNPDSVVSFDGQTMNPDFGKIKSSHSPFQMQFGARFVF